jgi:hypothetical protein
MGEAWQKDQTVSQTASALPHPDGANQPADDAVRRGTKLRVFELLLEPRALRWELAAFISVSLILTRTSADFAAYVKSISSFLFQ